MNDRTALAFTDDRTHVGGLANAFGDAFVTDDIVDDVGEFAEAYGLARRVDPECGAIESRATPRPLPPQASREASPRVTTFVINRSAVGRSPQRFHQSNPGGQCQMGGARQTNRFFARRQYS